MINSSIRIKCVGFDQKKSELRGFVAPEYQLKSFEIQNNPQSIPKSGDWVEIAPENPTQPEMFKIINVYNSWANSTHWLEHFQNPRRKRGVEFRRKTKEIIRNYFLSQGFSEVETPLLVLSPGMETHIRPLRVLSHKKDSGAQAHQGAFLPTSPEFALKKALAGGLDKVFELSRSFREEPDSPQHHIEFTMLEFYRAWSDEKAVQTDVECLFLELLKLRPENGKYKLAIGDQESGILNLDLTPPWPRLSIPEVFEHFTGLKLWPTPSVGELQNISGKKATADKAPSAWQDSWDDQFQYIWLNLIEPRITELSGNRPFFLCDYPPSQAALSEIHTLSSGPFKGGTFARRFEVYFPWTDGTVLELGNAFFELRNPTLQKARFEKDMELRTEIYGDGLLPNPIDAEFLRALEESYPPTCGIALGFDRMVMLAANEKDIRFTRYLDSYWT